MTRSETFFADVDRDLIIIHVVVTGPKRRANGRFVLDTGAAVTTMTPQMAAMIGYGARDSHRRTRVQTALGAESGYLVRVAEFAALGFVMRGLSINVFALAGMYIHGLLGMNFLSNFNYEVRSGEQRILVEKIAT